MSVYEKERERGGGGAERTEGGGVEGGEGLTLAVYILQEVHVSLVID